MNKFSTPTSIFSKNISLNINGKIMDLSTPRVMGILNATPDSFYEGSRLQDHRKAMDKAATMIRDGADFLDVGAVSTRPGASPVTAEIEKERLKSILEPIRDLWPEFPVSVDTWRSEIAAWAHENYQIQLINDISAGSFDEKMFPTMARLGIPYILMHMQGTPENMQDDPDYIQVVDDLLSFFSERVEALRKLGMTDIIIDPGFGFGKSLEQNYELLRELDSFQILELPILVGISRKSMIYKVLETEPDHALNGSTALHMAALMKGARLLRVHDVKEAVECIRIFQQI